MLTSTRVCVLDIPNLDAAPYYMPIEADTPFPQIRIPSGHAAVHLTRYEDVKIALGDPAISRTLCNVEGGPTFLPGTTQKELLLNLDDPAHARSRATISKDFSPRGVETLREVVDATVRRGIADMLEGKRAPNVFASVLEDVTSTAVCHILGIPLQDRPMFQQWSRIIQVVPPDDVAGIEVAVKACYSYLMEFVTGQRAAAPDGFIRRYVDNRRNMHEPLDDAEFVGVLLGILLGGDHNALSVMTKCVYTLLCAPSLWAHIVGNPTRIPTMIEELIRLIPIGKLSAFPRIATREIVTSVGTIPEGSVVYANVFLANRDPEVFPEPLTIDPERINTKPHLQFGYGIHSCMGPALARLEISIVLNALVAMAPSMQLDADPDSLRWINGTVLRRPDELPVRFDALAGKSPHSIHASQS
ncbi:cytochrome P450 [Paraburkholderia diazotrophica]|uniref:Cytochrome P450 n=1 Tax=Paraburkholderia diazotrophica TaxID=667676 RepID=A0A1H7DGX3_9BURK|nr:cytochrome P450 [Paraburkholderia diazotrophica]SEK00956.1 Cytochrome P450 [Paraburkholderia diazotrophica]